MWFGSRDILQISYRMHIMTIDGTSLPIQKEKALNRADEVEDVRITEALIVSRYLIKITFQHVFLLILSILPWLTSSPLQLLNAVQKLILPFIRSADEDAAAKETGHGLSVPGGVPRTALVEHHRPQELVKLLDFQLPEGQGKGKEGLLAVMENILKYSVNTWDQGYMHSLYSSTNAVRIQIPNDGYLLNSIGRRYFWTSPSCVEYQCELTSFLHCQWHWKSPLVTRLWRLSSSNCHREDNGKSLCQPFWLHGA